MPTAFFNGKFIPLEQVKLPVLDRGFLYGDGVFESLRTYNGRPFLLAEHLRRLLTGAKFLKIKSPYSLAQLKAAVLRVVVHNKFPETYIKIIITRGAAKGHGLDFSNAVGKPNVIILAEPASEKKVSGWKVIISTIRRANIPTAHIKSLCYLDNALAKEEARQADADEAIMLDDAGFVAEGTVSNIFIVKNGVISTPPTKEPILVGITRQFVIKLARKAGIPVRERKFRPSELFSADEAFATMSGAGIIPIGRGCSGPITLELIALYKEAANHGSL